MQPCVQSVYGIRAVERVRSVFNSNPFKLLTKDLSKYLANRFDDGAEPVRSDVPPPPGLMLPAGRSRGGGGG